jgi:hypothetical protein
MSKFNNNLFGLLVASALLCSSARVLAAPSMKVEAVGYQNWNDALAELRTSGVSGSSRLQLVVYDEHYGRIACRDYVIHLEPTDTALAFSLGECDPATNQTELLLIDRHKLFAHEGGLSQPVNVTSPTASSPPPPPPPPPPKPGAEPTCWAVVGPTITDPDTHLPFTLDPSALGVATLTEPKYIYVQKIPFDHAWLLRVKQSDHLRELRFALAPWYATKHRGIEYSVHSGVVYQPLQMHCDDNDPLGQWTPDVILVPDRVATTDSSGQQVVLTRNWRSGWIDVANWAGYIGFSLGGWPLLAGIPFTIIALANAHSGIAPFVGPTLLGTGVVMLVGGALLASWAGPKKELQAFATTETPHEPSKSSLASDLHFEGAGVAVDPARGSATLALNLSF